VNALGLLARVAVAAITATALGGALVLVVGLASLPTLAAPTVGVLGVVSGVVLWLVRSGRGAGRRTDTVYW
jgi:hypothetical protein